MPTYTSSPKAPSRKVESFKDSHPFSHPIDVTNQYKWDRSFSGNGFFSGTVSDNGIVQEGASVQVWHRTTNTLAATVLTEADGNYYVGNLSTGEMFDLIAIDPTGVWERKVSSSRYPKSGYYAPLSLRVYGTLIYEPDTHINLKSRAYGGDGAYSYAVDNSDNGILIDSDGLITSDIVSAGSNIDLTVTASDGSGQSAQQYLNVRWVNDIYWRHVSSLQHFEGVDGSTSFVDDTDKTWSGSGTNYGISSAQSKFGSCLHLQSASIVSDSYSDLSFNTGDFTVEFWIYCTNAAVQENIWGIGSNPLSSSCTAQIYKLGGSFRYWTGADLITSSSSAVIANQWQHIAVSRSGDSVKLFVDGFQVGSTATDSRNHAGTKQGIGTGSVPLYNTFIDEIRITTGASRYGSNFTPATAPFSIL